MNWLKRIFSNNKAPVSSPPLSCEVTHYDAEHFWGKSVLCDAYLLKGSFTLNEIADFVRETRSKHPNTQLLATLDYPAQAAYTSGHSTDIHELDALNEYDETNLPDNAFKQYEDERIFIGYFPIRHGNFMKEVAKHAPHNMENQLGWVGLDKYSASVRTRATVATLKRDTESLVQIVPVQNSAEALAAFPNGYFDADLDPFENYALARDLNAHFGLSLFGVGATYLGFMADESLDDAQATNIADYLNRCIDHTSPLDKTLFETIRGQSEIYIAYGWRE